MAVTTIEAKIEDGQVRLPNDLHLPNRAKVYVVIPDDEGEVIEMPPLPKVAYFRSPRVVYDNDSARLQVVMIEE